MTKSNDLWHGQVNGRTYVIRCEGGLYQANELGAAWVSGWTETLELAAEEIVEHVTSTPKPSYQIW
jgi:hypothetical protein